MPAAQATRGNRTEKLRRRRSSKLAGWIIIFLCAQVVLNLPKRALSTNQNSLADRNSPAQTQANLSNQERNNGRRWAYKPMDVRTVTIIAKNTRGTRHGPTLLRHTLQGESTQATTCDDRCDRTRVTKSVRNLGRKMQGTKLANGAKDLISPGPKSADGTSQFSLLANNRKPPVMADESTILQTQHSDFLSVTSAEGDKPGHPVQHTLIANDDEVIMNLISRAQLESGPVNERVPTHSETAKNSMSGAPGIIPTGMRRPHAKKA